MLDDFSFFDDPGESTSYESGQESGGEQPQDNGSGSGGGQEQAPQNVSVEQFNELQKRLDNAERWRQDVGRMFTGEQPQQPQMNQQQLLEQFLTNPAGVLENYTQQASRQAQEAYQQEAILQDRRAKHPELAKVEHLIDWNGVMQTAAQSFYQANHRSPSFAEALDGAIALVKNNLHGTSPGGQPQNGGSRTVMNMDIGGNANAGNSRPVDLAAVSDADWPKMRDAIRRSQGF